MKSMSKSLYLLNFTVSGIKNITNDLKLEFYKKTVNKSFDPSNYRIKGIYGENGCGKSALITAVQILKDIICNRDRISEQEYQSFLEAVVNRKLGELRLGCEFYHYADDGNHIYRYRVYIRKNQDRQYVIDSEELTIRKADYPAAKVSDVYVLTSNGEIYYSEDASKHEAIFKEFGACLYTNVKPCEKDLRSSFTAENNPEQIETFLHKLARFVQVVRPELVGIEAGDAIRNDIILNYGDYKLSLDQESSGIRKLIGLYPYLEALEAARIVFIDEMDTDINEIVFDRIIAYIGRYCGGQLCFTAQNSTAMTELRKHKNAIDFLSSDGQIIPWRTSGNFSPESLYKNGMIERLPFNIEPESFLGLIGD